MIQRIQSIFLALVAGCLIAMSFFPLWSKADMEAKESVKLTAQSMIKNALDESGAEIVVEERSTIFIAIVALIAAGIAIYSIFQYKNRLTQMKLGALNALLMAATLGLTYWQSTEMTGMLNKVTHDSPLVGFMLIAAALVFNLSANRFIRKDEKLVKSMDRIR